MRVPTAAELPGRLGAILGVIHLLLTSAHTAPTGTANLESYRVLT